jgi:Uma2 family endonuclease
MNVVLDDSIRLPIGFASLAAFRQWTKSRAYPGRGNFAYLGGDLWVDLAMETLLHNQLQHLFEVVLGGLVMNEQLGMYFGDRMRLVNVGAVLSSEPDGMFASHKSIRSGRVRWEQGPESLEVIGAPDMVLEVVSSHSVQKDTVVLRELYGTAGISEYWLVNPIGPEASFDILRLTSRGYTTARKSDGWAKSTVFGRSFRLESLPATDDLPNFRLLVR